MPGSHGFTSQAQREYMYARHPEIARRMEAETPKGERLPGHVGKARKSGGTANKALAKMLTAAHR